MADTFFLTTAIDYTNGAPHIGHAYEKVLADVIARYRRLRGEKVFFLTGVDQHGQKVQQSADKQGIAPQEFVDGLTAKFRALWEKLDVRYDQWAATSDDRHKRCVQAILQRLWSEHDPATGESRWIYKDKRAGYYSVRQEQFLTDKERGVDGEFGPEWGEVEFREEENYYFRLLRHKQWLLDLLAHRTDLVLPSFRLGELRNAVEKLEGDLCISRPKSRLAWGIPFPFDESFVTFVWFDALVNYISFAPGYDPAPGADLTEFRRWWKSAIHIIGKDILIPAHGVYWPIMLHALGFADNEIPRLVVHGWWNVSGAKMSKSLGNVVDPDALADKYGAEALRYNLMSDITTGKDADFSEELLVGRYNNSLANALGNLLNRTLSMAHRYRDGVIRIWESDEPAGRVPYKSWEQKNRSQTSAGMAAAMLAVFEPSEAIKHMSSVIGSCNQFIEDNAPWKLAKSSVPEDVAGLDIVLYTLAESLRIIAILLSPVLPKAAHGIFDQLNWKMDQSGNDFRFHLADTQWGGLPDGHVLGKPTPLFPRIEAVDAAK